jgi:hypothetical protein
MDTAADATSDNSATGPLERHSTPEDRRLSRDLHSMGLAFMIGAWMRLAVGGKAVLLPFAAIGAIVVLLRLRAKVDDQRDRMQAKIRNAQLEKIPYMLVVGKREAEADSVAVRLRSGEDLGAMNVSSFIDLASSVIDSKSLSLTIG